MSNIEKKVITLTTGKELSFPIITEEAVNIGMRRKTRKLSGDKLNEELIWLIFEEYLDEEELETWDTLTAVEFEEAFKSGALEGELKK